MGLLTELSIGLQTDEILVLETSKRKSIFSTAFVLSSTVLALMWWAAKDIFWHLLQNKTVIDYSIVGIFYGAVFIYPIIALAFIAYHKSVTMDREKKCLTMATHFFGKPWFKRIIPFEKIEKIEVVLIRKAKNIAHSHKHLTQYENAGYWQVNAWVTESPEPIKIDRNTDKKEMIALGNFISQYTGAHLQSPELEVTKT